MLLLNLRGRSAPRRVVRRTTTRRTYHAPSYGGGYHSYHAPLFGYHAPLFHAPLLGYHSPSLLGYGYGMDYGYGDYYGYQHRPLSPEGVVALVFGALCFICFFGCIGACANKRNRRRESTHQTITHEVQH